MSASPCRTRLSCDGEGLSVLPVWMEGMGDLLDVLGPASDDEVSKSSHFWIIDEGLLESFFVGWCYLQA